MFNYNDKYQYISYIYEKLKTNELIGNHDKPI
jgi:hypothetical protein